MAIKKYTSRYSGTEIDSLLNRIPLKADNLFFNTADGKLYLTSEGEIIGDGVIVSTSGGGGSGGIANNAIFTLTKKDTWRLKKISESATDCNISGEWSSIEDGLDTGNGSIIIKINGSTKYSQNIAQGAFTIDLKPYLVKGTNEVRVTVSDTYGNSKSLNYTVDVITLLLKSSFDGQRPYNGQIDYFYTPIGGLEKTVHFLLDGVELPTQTVTASNVRQSYTIPKSRLDHGSHSFEIYFDGTVEGETVSSNRLYYDLICTDAGNTTPIIACNFNRTTASQYETINIPYIVWTPEETTEITLSDGTTTRTLNVNRSQQNWSYRLDTSGDVTLTISCGAVEKIIELEVAETAITVTPATTGLELYLSSYGKSNADEDYNVWEYNGISCIFSGHNWINDGWQTDDNGVTVHRLTNGAKLTIPIKIFENDFKANGKTIEVEFSTKEVFDYNGLVGDCFNNDKGLRLYAQKALFKSESSEIITQYKENERVRLSFVIDNEEQLIYVYLNGIMCGVSVFDTNDNFQQGTSKDLVFSSDNCTIDLYTIRVYNNALTSKEIINNWIYDTQTLSEKIVRFTNNDILNDDQSTISYEKLPNNLPYLIIDGELPTFKGNKKTISGQYVNKENPNKSFTFENAIIDVQGTSSVDYARKNYKITFENGFVQNGTSREGYQLRDNSIPTNVFTFKADVASSEGANNVELVRLYNDICPYKTPPQLVDPKVRQGIDGLPIVIFHSSNGEINFIGKYNFNNDKATPEVFGFDNNDESWEIKNNTSNRVLFKNADFSGTSWKNDFEARHPEDNENITKLAEFVRWVVSTDQSAADNSTIEPITYDDIEYTTDSAAYRLAKFKAELSNYAVVDSALFYYLFTELFLMVDSRAKNAFPTWFDNGKVCWLPYDMDTALGIDNVGALVFSYDLEDTDKTASNENVYAGQDSVFWINIRQAFGDEIKEMYQKLRSDNKLSYNIVEKAFEEHQETWPEMVWNEDAYYKYLQPLIEDGDSKHLSMLQGDKKQQRKWWLYNRFRYMDSKYHAGDTNNDTIVLRINAKANIVVEPYASIYASASFASGGVGTSYFVQGRALVGNKATLVCPLDTATNIETKIFSASQLKSVGDLRGLKIGFAGFSNAVRLQELKIGGYSSSNTNDKLTELVLGENILLKKVDASYSPNLGTGTQQFIDLSNCKNIQEVNFLGTSIKGVKLPNGGILKTLKLPATVTNLTIRNQNKLTTFSMQGYDNLTTLWLENINESVVPITQILQGMKSESRVRLIGVNWSYNYSFEAINILESLNTFSGLDENGNNTDNAQISGNLHIGTVYSDEQARLTELLSLYPNINFTYDILHISNKITRLVERTARTANSDSVTKVGLHAFNSSEILTTANFPNATSIENWAFESCYVLTTANIPNATSVINGAFSNCSSLTTVIIGTKQATVATLSSTIAFQGCCHILGTTNTTYNPTGAKDGYIYVPLSLVDDYRKATNWSRYATQIMPCVDTVANLTNIDSTTYDKVYVGENSTEYTYNGIVWEVYTR